MANIEHVELVVKDAEGNYFLVPHETLERGRVPEEQRAEIERLIGDADTTGHLAGGFAVMAHVLAPTPLNDGQRVTFQDFHFVAKASKPSPSL
jgi:hypothetical protein